jgi:serpin B
MKWFRVLMLVVLLGLAAHSVQAQQPPDQEVLVNSNTTFAFTLYQAAPKDDPNFVFSPYSISQALAMTHAGARGDTATQMAAVLAFTLEPAALGAAFNTLNADLVARGNAEANDDLGQSARQLRLANALWGEQTFPFYTDYLALVEASYGAPLHLTDFINAPDAARDTINAWVAEQTADRIQDILPADVVGPDTRLVLTNAIYFKGAWFNPFNQGATVDAPFFLLDGSTVDVPMMHTTAFFGYAEGEGYRAVQLSYQGSDLALLVMVPDDFVAFEAALTAEIFNSIARDITYTQVQLGLPRFTFETALSLSETLKALGMTDAFDSGRADFSGMAAVAPDANLYISDALHKAFIAVDEEGTEAAAATAIIMGVTSAPADEPRPFTVDHPFIFAIRDMQTGSVLFLGRVLDPLAQ